MTRVTLLVWAAIASATAACHSTSGTGVTTTTGATAPRDAGVDYSPAEPTPQSLSAPWPVNTGR
jgi:hypothetical protein